MRLTSLTAMRRLTVVLCLLQPGWAHAHLVSTRFGEYYAGLLHPVTTLTHLVPWLALGLLAGLQSAPQSRHTLLLFPLAVLLGSALGSLLPPQHWLDVINLLSFLLLGGLVLLARPLPVAAYCGLILATGISHGYANGMPELYGKNLGLYLAGVTTAAYLLVTVLTATSRQLITRPSWGIIAVRAGGSWIAAIGMMFLAFNVLIAPAAP